MSPTILKILILEFIDFHGYRFHIYPSNQLKLKIIKDATVIFYRMYSALIFYTIV